MGFFDEIKKLTHPYDDEDDEFLDEAELVDDDEPEQPPRRSSNPFSGFGSSSDTIAPQSSAAERRTVRAKEGKVVSIGSAQQMQVVLIRPERFETAADIADHLRDRRPVLINLETTPKDVTRRLVDFLSGVAYALDGRVKKVAANTYIITPHNVDIMGDQMDELETGSTSYFN